MEKEDFKKAEKLFNATQKVVDSKILSEKEKEPFQKINAQLAGVLLSSWLPRDWGRKIIMLIILLLAVFGALKIDVLFLLLLLILPIFSPRMMGGLIMFIGRIMGNK